MTAPPMPLALRFQLWRLLAFSESFGLALWETLTEVRVLGAMADPEIVRLIERAQLAEAMLAGFIRLRVNPEDSQ